MFILAEYHAQILKKKFLSLNWNFCRFPISIRVPKLGFSLIKKHIEKLVIDFSDIFHGCDPADM